VAEFTHTVLFIRRGKIRREGDFLVVDDSRYPVAEVLGIVVAGNAQVTTQAVRLALDHGIPIAWVRRGDVQGVSVPFQDRYVELRRRQWEVVLNRGSLRAAFAKSIVTTSIRARRAVLEFLDDLGFVDARPAINRLKRLERATEGSNRTGALRGYEGRAVRIYFRALSGALPSWAFSGRRTRRPPRDPFNAAIGLGYMGALLPVMTARTVAVGLDPFAGFLHEIRGRKPALVLDLMDEWRALAVDVPVLRLFLEGGLTQGDFHREGSGVRVQSAESVLAPVLSVLSRVRGGLLNAVDERLKELRNGVRKGSAPGPLKFDTGDVGAVWEVVQGKG